MLIMISKRGQGLSTNAIVLIILAVVVLAVLVIGFTMGWDRLAPWLSTSNVDTIVTQCSVACATNAVNDYCVTERTLKTSDLPDNQKSVQGTCKLFATNPAFSLLNIEDCSASLCTPDKCDEAGGFLVAPKEGTECPKLGYGNKEVGGTYLPGMSTSPDKKICCKY